MTQEFVKLPRHVAEHAVASIEMLNTGKWAQVTALAAALRAALDQPQGEQPAMTPIAQRKLDSLLTEGYTISGYSVYHEQKHQHGFVTGAGLVGWWRPEGMKYPQPQVEQEPVAAQHRFRHPQKTMPDWSVWQPCDVAKRPAWNLDSQGYEVEYRALYTHPQPKREPLTDECIYEISEDLKWYDGDCDRYDIYGIARAIEAAHKIGCDK